MPRPRRMRRVGFMPGFTSFGPSGIKGVEEVILSIGEFESIRLKDFQGFGQSEAAKKMNVSQPTFNRILNAARKKIADALIYGKLIRIEGGDYKMIRPRMGSGPGRGRKGGIASGPVGDCVCPKCGHKTTHGRGMPCYSQKCPKCGTAMTRG